MLSGLLRSRGGTALLCGCSTRGAALLQPRPWLQASTRLLATEEKGSMVMNEGIQTEKIRLVMKDAETGKSTSSIVTRTAALQKARAMGLDLVLVSNASEPWVCKLLDVKREKYLKEKKEKRTKRASQVMKELSIRGNISDHDLLIKLRRVTDFFHQGHAVRLTLQPTYTQSKKKPRRLQELRDFIVNEFFVDKCKNIVEIEPPPPTDPDAEPPSPGSIKKEIILYPKKAMPQQQPVVTLPSSSSSSDGGKPLTKKTAEEPSQGE